MIKSTILHIYNDVGETEHDDEIAHRAYQSATVDLDDHYYRVIAFYLRSSDGE